MWMLRLQKLACLKPQARRLQRSEQVWPPVLFSALTLTSRELSSEGAAKATTAEEAIKTASTVKDDLGPQFENAAAEGAASTTKASSSWRGFKALFGLTAIAAVGGVSYVTYAYTTEDVDRMIEPLREPPTSTTSQDGELLQRIQNLLYTTACEVALKTAETYLELRRSIEDQVRGFAAPSSDKLLPDLIPQEQHVYTIVLDLNETLVYSDWKRERGWGTFKRPGVEPFLEKLAHYYEIVVYSDQLSFYVDPILERLDQKGCIRYRLARDATYYVDGKHYRDLSKLNRDPKKVMYISGHALETCLQPENAVPIKPWKLEENDTALLDLLPFLEFVARQRPPDVRTVLASYKGRDIATEFKERAKQNQRRVAERKQQGGRFWRGV